jgi:Ca-activated chloride channel family protein
MRSAEKGGRAVRPLVALCLAALFVVTPRAQARLRQPAATFSSKADLVVLHVTVLDRKAGFIAGLPREAFTVYEEDQAQTISFFRNEDTPVTVGLVIDSSMSMQRRRDGVIAAGLAFAQSSHPRDEMFTVNFNEQVWPGLPRYQDFTSDVGELRQALSRATARGRTALFDAIRVALEHLNKGTQQKKVLVVISDGSDNSSRTTFDSVLVMAQRMNAVIYTIGLSDEYDRDDRPDVLKRLATATGAEAFFPDDGKITSTLERIARDIRSGYTIGYVPADAPDDGSFRAVRVKVSSPDRRRLKVRTRSGYVATPRSTSRSTS